MFRLRLRSTNAVLAVSGLTLSLLLAGCSSTNISEVIKAMSGDTATVCATVVVAGSTVNIARTNIMDGDVTCNGNGLAVKATPGVTPVPVKVTPVQ